MPEETELVGDCERSEDIFLAGEGVLLVGDHPDIILEFRRRMFFKTSEMDCFLCKVFTFDHKKIAAKGNYFNIRIDFLEES